MLVSMTVTEGIGYEEGKKEQGMKLDFIDVRRAYFHADTRTEIYIDLPDEDATPGMRGKLNKSMYGTRAEAQNWEIKHSN